MKTTAILCFFVISLVLNVSCSKSEKTDQRQDIKLSSSQKAVLASANTFGLQLFDRLGTATASGDNLFLSPLSVSLALTMAYNGAAGNTAFQMQQVLGCTQMSPAEINLACKDLMHTLQSIDPDIAMEIANSIWYRNDFTPRADFLSLNQTYFDAAVKAVDFSDARTPAAINDWVSQKTHDKIESIVDQVIDPLTVMYLINAIYFKGTWKYSFDASKSHAGPFQVPGSGPVQVQYMTRSGSFRYMANAEFAAAELPYGNDYFSMVVVLPNEDVSASTVLHHLAGTGWNDCVGNLAEHSHVNLTLPKFKTESDLMLNSALSDLGMTDAFSKVQADFTGISEAYPLYISKVKHKAYIETNEAGTEAAAVTSVEISITAVGPGYDDTITFNVNRPFLFLIKENTTNSIIFAGMIQHP